MRVLLSIILSLLIMLWFPSSASGVSPAEEDVTECSVTFFLKYVELLNEDDLNLLARLVYGESGGIPSLMEQSAVIWCVLNRIDAGYGDTVYEVISAPNQFPGYADSEFPVKRECYLLAKDVMLRWYVEKYEDIDSGRVLPKEYLYYHGDGEHNWFRISCNNSNDTIYWNWSLKDVYKEGNLIIIPNYNNVRKNQRNNVNRVEE